METDACSLGLNFQELGVLSWESLQEGLFMKLPHGVASTMFGICLGVLMTDSRGPALEVPSVDDRYSPRRFRFSVQAIESEAL